jgi:hypothetical protein
VAILEPGDGWRPAPRFAPLDGERVPVARLRIPRMPTLGVFAMARLVRRMRVRLLSRLQKGRRPKISDA